MKQTLGINTISGRLLILGVFPAMLAISAIVVLSAIAQRRNLGDAERRVLAACAVGAVEELQVRLNMWNSIAESMALAQEQGLHKEPAGSEAYARDLLKALYPGAAGVFVVRNAPAATETVDRRAAPPNAIGLRVSHGAAMDLRPFEVGDPEQMDAFRAAKAAFRPSGASRAIVTEPEQVQGNYVVTHACAFAINGQFGGVAGVERELSRLSSIAHDIQHRSDADVFLISRKGRIMPLR